MIEIHDLSFYDQALGEQANGGTPLSTSGEAAEKQTGLSEQHPDQLLERVVELEQLLADDLARKAKFQKPQRQRQWQQELDELTARLDAL